MRQCHSTARWQSGKKTQTRLFGSRRKTWNSSTERFRAYPTTHSELFGSSSLLEIRDRIPITRAIVEIWQSRFGCESPVFENTLSDLRALYDNAGFQTEYITCPWWPYLLLRWKWFRAIMTECHWFAKIWKWRAGESAPKSETFRFETTNDHHVFPCG